MSSQAYAQHTQSTHIPRTHTFVDPQFDKSWLNILKTSRLTIKQRQNPLKLSGQLTHKNRQLTSKWVNMGDKLQPSKNKFLSPLLSPHLSPQRHFHPPKPVLSTRFHWHKNTLSTPPSCARIRSVNLIPQPTKKSAESAIYSHSTGKIQPISTPIKLLQQKTGVQPVKN